MKVYNAFFEGMDGFKNTQKGADRVRAILPAPEFNPALDGLLAMLIETNEDAEGVANDVAYITDQLAKFSQNVAREMPKGGA